MLKDTNHQNSNCSFGDQVAAYLYDEASASEKSAFENHLSNCANCTDEIAQFAAVLRSIADWRDREFSVLASPVIEIPRPARRKTSETTNIPGSWLDGLRRIFAVSPSRLAGGAAIGLIVCCGLIFAAMSFFQASDVAEIPNTNRVQAMVSPTIESIDPLPNNEPQSPPNETVAPRRSNAPFLSKDESKAEHQTRNAVRVSDAPKNKTSRQNPPVAAANQTENKNKPMQRRIAPPQLEDFADEEDETLRLADLFAEIDTDE